MPALALAAYAIGIGLSGTATVWGMTAGTVYFMAALEALTLTISYFTYQHNKSRMKEMLDGMGKFSGSGFLANTRSSEEPLPVLYGRHRLGGNQVYISSTGCSW